MAPKCTPNIGNYLAYNNHNHVLECCILSKVLNTCSQPLTTKQMISLRLQHQKMNEENDRLKEQEPEAVTCEYHRS